MSFAAAGLGLADPQFIKRGTRRLRILGVLLLVLGAIAMVCTITTTIATVIAIGVMLLIASGAEIAGAFWTRDWAGFLTLLLTGVLFGVAGALMTIRPLMAAEALTLLLAGAFIAGGVVRILASFAQRFDGWFWLFLNGVITLALGIMIAAEWPMSGLVVIGTFVGIDLIFTGCICLAMASAVRDVTKAPPATPAS